jgi:hypothetical protein
MDETTKSFRKDCDFHHSLDGQAGRCNMMYAEGMFVTYDNGGNLVTTYSSESDKYPLSVLDTFLYSKQTSDPYPWTTRRRPIGHGIYMSFSGDVANYDAQRKSVP